MRSAWSREAAAEAAPGLPPRLRHWLSTRFTRGELPTVGLVLLITVLVAQSTVAMDWVRGSEIFSGVALLGVLAMTALALLRFIPSWLALPAGGLLAWFVPWWLNRSALLADHPGAAFGVPTPDTWITDLSGVDQNIDLPLFLFLGCVLFFAVGGWLDWCSVRWRKPMLGLAPVAAVFATNVLNSTDEQNANTIYFLVLTFGLLLWNGYRSSLIHARRAGLRLSSDSRWDFWETGVAATAAITLLAIFVPPLTHDDQTVNVENGVFRSWAQFEQSLNHPVEVGRGGSAVYSTGFSLDAGLNGPLKKSDKVVFTYTATGQTIGARYFRGVNLQNGVRPNQWGFLNNPFGFQFFVAKGSPLPYDETGLREQQGATFTIRMVRPPAIAPDVLFYPGQLQKTDRDAVIVESYKTAANPDFGTVDRVASQHPPSSAGTYKVTIAYPNPTEDELRNAGADYPAWIAPYLTYPGLTSTPAFATGIAGSAGGKPVTSLTIVPAGEASSVTAVRIKALADQVIAGSTNPYDEAAAIETYLRSNYQYTLTPPAPKDGGTDTLASFLFDSKQGYCEYFATAMGDMLRAEGIPSRLVSGYGPGTYDSRIKQYVVKGSDAHTWVEAYFPSYGWIPFEPTPDGNYFPISRAVAPSTCNRDQCATGIDESNGAAVGGKSKTGIRDLPGGDVPNQTGPLSGGGGFPYWVLVPLALLALAALAFFAGGRYLRPKTAGGVWKRVSLLTRLAGYRGPPGETPAESGRRLAAVYPEAAGAIRSLTESFAVAAYAPAEVARPRAAEVVESWEEVRPHLLRRVVERLRPAA